MYTSITKKTALSQLRGRLDEVVVPLTLGEYPGSKKVKKFVEEGEYVIDQWIENNCTKMGNYYLFCFQFDHSSQIGIHFTRCSFDIQRNQKKDEDIWAWTLRFKRSGYNFLTISSYNQFN